MIRDEIGMTEDVPDNIKEAITEATSPEQYKKWVYAVLAKQPHWQIELSEWEKRVLNLFTFYDRFGIAKDLRRLYTKKHSICEKCFQDFGPKTEEQRMVVIHAAKEDITKKMIYHRSVKSPKFKKVYLRKTLRTPCGWLRLGVTLAHNKKAFLSFKMIYHRLVENTKFKKVYLRKSLNKAHRLLVSLTNAVF